MRIHRSPPSRPLVIVERCDEVGSAVARELHATGYGVILSDDAAPCPMAGAADRRDSGPRDRDRAVT